MENNVKTVYGQDKFPTVSVCAKSGTAEVDFVIQDNSKIVPVEVKASVNLKAKSLASYRDQYHPEKAGRQFP